MSFLGSTERINRVSGWRTGMVVQGSSKRLSNKSGPSHGVLRFAELSADNVMKDGQITKTRLPLECGVRRIHCRPKLTGQDEQGSGADAKIDLYRPSVEYTLPAWD